MSTITRRLGASLGSVCLALATAAVVTAGPADAALSNLTVKPGIDGRIATTCTYEVSVKTTSTGDVLFTAAGLPIGDRVSPSNGVATVQWTPKLPGKRKIRALQVDEDAVTKTVSVVPGLNLGSLCFGLG